MSERTAGLRAGPIGLWPVLLVLAALGTPLAAAQEPPPPPNGPAGEQHPHHPPPAAAGDDRATERQYFSDVVLINQLGQPMRFYSDLLAGKTVVINAFFTSCTGVCPVLSSRMARLQDWLGDRLGRDVHLISLSVDPETDTPEKLEEYAERFGARPGWYLLGGAKENVDQALHRVGQYVEDKEAHTNVMIIGNEPARVWRKAFGLAEATELIQVLDATLAESP